MMASLIMANLIDWLWLILLYWTCLQSVNSFVTKLDALLCPIVTNFHVKECLDHNPKLTFIISSLFYKTVISDPDRSSRHALRQWGFNQTSTWYLIVMQFRGTVWGMYYQSDQLFTLNQWDNPCWYLQYFCSGKSHAMLLCDSKRKQAIFVQPLFINFLSQFGYEYSLVMSS